MNSNSFLMNGSSKAVALFAIQNKCDKPCSKKKELEGS